MKLRTLMSFCCVAGLISGAPAPHPIHAEGNSPNQPAATTIIVNSTEDPESGSLTRTCGYTAGIFNAQTDGKCTLRRAILEASARPQAQRPINIQFNIPLTDTNANLEVAGTWTVQITAAFPPLKTDSIVNVNGQVTIDGSTQPTGRNGAPRIIVDTHDNSLQVESSNNIIRNLSWKGGGTIFLKRDGNLVENLWMGLSDDGQSLQLRTPGDPKRLAQGGGVYVLNANNNTVRSNVVSGAFARAIDIQGTNNVVTGNIVGTRANGTVPDVVEGIQCLASFDFDPNSWYGGWGMQIAGTGNTVQNNRLVGMHNLRSANDTAPIAIEVFGNNHLIKDNIIGLDSAGKDYGVCGQGILVSGNGTQIVDNRVVRSQTGFEATNGDALDAAILASDSSPTFGRITVRRNTVIDGPGKVYYFGPGIPTVLKSFYPSSAKQINGVNVIGSDGYQSPCPNCIVDLYTDDGDANQESLSYVGTSTADANGNWTYTLAAPLPTGTVLRTMSTVQSAGIIGNLGAGTTTRMSAAAQPPSGVTITGPLTSTKDQTNVYTFTVTPIALSLPLTVTLGGTDYPSTTLVTTDGIFTSNRRWTTNGLKTVRVLVVNEMGSTTSTLDVQVGAVDGKLFLPLIQK